MNSATALRPLRASALAGALVVRRHPLLLIGAAAILAVCASVLHLSPAPVAADRPMSPRSVPAIVTPHPALPAPLPAPIAAAVPTTTEEAAASLPFSLFGTVAQRDPSAGSALVGTTAQNASLYGTNVEIVPGILIREVYSDHIVVEQHGVRTVLALSWTLGKGGNHARVETARRPEELIGSGDMLRTVPTSPTERVQGLHVFPGRNRGGFARIGLHIGDILTEVSGQSVVGTHSEDLQGLLRDTGATTVTVFRAGRIQRIRVNGDPGELSAPHPEGSSP